MFSHVVWYQKYTIYIFLYCLCLDLPIPSSPATDWTNLDGLYVRWLNGSLVGCLFATLGWHLCYSGLFISLNSCLMMNCWIADLLKYWNTEVLKCWIAVLLKCWNAKMLKCWIAEMLEYWNVEMLKMLKCYKAEILKCWNTEIKCWNARILKS